MKIQIFSVTVDFEAISEDGYTIDDIKEAVTLDLDHTLKSLTTIQTSVIERDEDGRIVRRSE